MDRIAPRESPDLRCSYCHAPADDAASCAACGTLTHPGCRAEVGGCVTIGCSAAASRRPSSERVTKTRAGSRLAGRVVRGAVSAGVCLVGAVAFDANEESMEWAWLLLLRVAFVLGFLSSLLFIAIAVMSEAICFVLNLRWRDRDWLR